MAQNSSIASGKLTLQDLANYKPKQRPAVCGGYRSYNVCGMAPPSSGGVAVIQLLGQLEPYNLAGKGVSSLETAHLFTQSSRLTFADRNRYIADDDFVSVPVDGLISREYLAERSKLININADMGKAKAGHPKGALAQADDLALELPSTSHISIVDKQGNAISMTTSVEMAFGSAVMVEGFILNNQLTDFSLSPKVNGKFVANRLEPLKRPRSSMAPTMVFNADNSLKLVSPPFYRQEVRSEETNASCGLASERPIVKPSPTVLHSDLICVSGGDHKHRPRDQGVGYVSELVDAGLFDREPVDATKPVPDRLH